MEVVLFITLFHQQLPTPKLSLNDILNMKARVIRMMRYKGPFCSPLELLGDWTGLGTEKKENTSVTGNNSFSTKRLCFFLICMFAASRLKLRRIIGRCFCFCFSRDEWKWGCFPCAGVKYHWLFKKSEIQFLYSWFFKYLLSTCHTPDLVRGLFRPQKRLLFLSFSLIFILIMDINVFFKNNESNSYKIASVQMTNSEITRLCLHNT